MKNLIGISGKIGSGKDTLGKIIQYLDCTPPSVIDIDHMMKFIKDNQHVNNLNMASNWKNKKFADKLKDCVCLLIGCTRQQLEDRNFKEIPLGPEWDTYEVDHTEPGVQWPLLFLNEEEAKESAEMLVNGVVRLRKMTPRLMLQLLGTEAGRNIIHPNIWVNASFTDYKELKKYPKTSKTGLEKEGLAFMERPNWIFTDMRFPNELEAIKSRGGITIRVNRVQQSVLEAAQSQHVSETALGNAEFDYVINNNGTIEDLIDKTREILKLENII